MKTGLGLLIIGGGLLAAGLVVAGFSTFAITKEVLEGAVMINATSLEPGQSSGDVLKDLPTDRQLLFSLSSDPSDVPLRVQITDPDGERLVMYNVTTTPFTGSVATKKEGDHTLEITNVGTRAVTINGALIHSPIVEQGGGVSVEDNPSLQTFITYGIGILVGAILVIAGIVVLIIGAIKYSRGRKSPESVPPS
ncbi:MAG: DUF4870 domain-containing protein [Nitrososphaera sp.]|nr:DUF4870 domain-containing protein [Nitrososphaera sp.]